MTTNMNRTILRVAAIALMLFSTLTAWADEYSGSCGTNVTWPLTDEDGDGTKETLAISGTGAMADKSVPAQYPVHEEGNIHL
jgi:hypothetical protein